MRSINSPSVLLAFGIAILLAFAFLGSRGIWDPDEGRYTNVALNMLESGDWVHPMRNDYVGHWTKPPLTYWAIAASIGAFGSNPWAARLPCALSYFACVWLVWRIARRLVPERANEAALIYATLLLPFGAVQLITTDFLLAAACSAAMACWIESRFTQAGNAGRWLLAMWFCFALAFLIKGPPSLLYLLVIAVCAGLLPQARSTLAWHAAGFAAVWAGRAAVVRHRHP
jgi:4-amino-4-deoxy-L-arabinose transferase-like glycosyltransferase